MPGLETATNNAFHCGYLQKEDLRGGNILFTGSSSGRSCCIVGLIVTHIKPFSHTAHTLRSAHFIIIFMLLVLSAASSIERFHYLYFYEETVLLLKLTHKTQISFAEMKTMTASIWQRVDQHR